MRACLAHHLNVIGFQPEVDLEEIGQHLRAGHELAVPWFSVVRGAGEEAGQFLLR